MPSTYCVRSLCAICLRQLSSCFIISYFGFVFTSTYNSILFCCLWRNVEPCCHRHNSRTTMIVYSARPRLVSLALYTITDHGDCLQHVTLGRPIPAVNKKPDAKCDIQTTVQQLLIEKPDIRCESRFQLTPPTSTPPLGGFPSEYCRALLHVKTTMAWLLGGKNCLKISLFVSTECTNVTDRQTDRHPMTAIRPCFT